MFTRTRLLVVALSLALVRSVEAQATPDSVVVSQAHAQWFRGLLTADTITLSSVLAADVTFGFANGRTLPRTALLQALQSGQLRYSSVNEELVRVRAYGAAAVVTGRATLAYRAGGTEGSEHVTYTATYLRVNSTWRMVAWQSTLIPPS